MDSNLLKNIVGAQAAASVCASYKSLTEVHQATHEELTALQAVGAYKANQLKSALALARDLSREILGDAPVLDTPERVAAYLREDYRPHTTEVFTVIALNTRRRVVKSWTVATGTLDTLLVHAREVFRHAITCNAAAICLVHGHPSGDPTPSEADIKVTRDIIRAGQLLKIEVVDHVILGRATPERTKDYASLRELGYFYAA